MHEKGVKIFFFFTMWAAGRRGITIYDGKKVTVTYNCGSGVVVVDRESVVAAPRKREREREGDGVVATDSQSPPPPRPQKRMELKGGEGRR
jgi:hypothetical protein